MRLCKPKAGEVSLSRFCKTFIEWILDINTKGNRGAEF